MDSQDYAWEYVTVDSLVCKGPCELVYVCLVPSGATTNSAIYDGLDTHGKKIIDLPAAAVTFAEFAPAVPLYCAQGLYVDVGSSVTGILVQYRPL